MGKMQPLEMPRLSAVTLQIRAPMMEPPHHHQLPQACNRDIIALEAPFAA